MTGLHEVFVYSFDQPEGVSSFPTRRASDLVKFDPLVIERNMDGSTNDKLFKDWFNEMFQLDGNSNGSSVRRNGAIIKLENGQEVLRYAFYEGFVKSSKFADLEAGSNNLFKQ